MARRRAPAQRWRVGDRCQVALELVTHYRPYPHREWSHTFEVVAVRGDRVVVRPFRSRDMSWERSYPWWRLRVPPKPTAYCRWRR